VEAKAELQKNCCFYGYRKENFIERKKEIVAFHLNNNPLSTAGWCKIG
jgi:hypothetical protein